MSRIRISPPPGFSFDSVVRSHGWYDLPPFSYDREGGSLETVVESGGAAVPVRFSRADGHLIAEGAIPPARLREIASRVFSLDVDLSSLRRDLEREPRLLEALDGGSGRILRAPTAFEDAVKMLFTTNCTWAATRGMVSRLIELAGAQGRAFPAASAVARFRATTLRARVRCGYRAEALGELARRVASGRLDLAQWEGAERPAAEIRDGILAERGFGPYAAEGFLRIFGRHDFLAIDTWVRQKYRSLYPGPRKSTDRAIARRYARFGASRGLALWLEMTADWRRE